MCSIGVIQAISKCFVLIYGNQYLETNILPYVCDVLYLCYVDSVFLSRLVSDRFTYLGFKEILCEHVQGALY